jgi:hypothetical protein
MQHDKTATLRSMIIRDYSRYRDELLDTDKSLFERFVELERERNNDVFDYVDLLQLLDDLDEFSIKISNDSYKSKIIDYIEKL